MQDEVLLNEACLVCLALNPKDVSGHEELVCRQCVDVISFHVQGVQLCHWGATHRCGLMQRVLTVERNFLGGH